MLLENKWSEKNIEPRLDFDEYTVYANEELMREVFINLIDNAIKFSPVGTEIEINARESATELCVSVTNVGFIEKEDIPKLFNKFYRTDVSHTTDGSGIGLAIVKKILDLHGFFVEVTSEDAKVTFAVFIKKSATER